MDAVNSFVPFGVVLQKTHKDNRLFSAKNTLGGVIFTHLMCFTDDTVIFLGTIQSICHLSQGTCSERDNSELLDPHKWDLLVNITDISNV